MSSELHVECFELGPFATNGYVVWRGGSSNCWIIDSPYMPEQLIAFVKEQGLLPRQLLLTHAHCDHIAGLDEIRGAFPDIEVLVHEIEKDWLIDAKLNLSAVFGLPKTVGPADRLLDGTETLDLDGLAFEIRHAPGHSPGSIVFYNAETATAFVGDTLFHGSIGRTDFPGCDHNTLIQSIQTQLLTLPDETKIYPGHMIPSSIGAERANNPFL